MRLRLRREAEMARRNVVRLKGRTRTFLSSAVMVSTGYTCVLVQLTVIDASFTTRSSHNARALLVRRKKRRPGIDFASAKLAVEWSRVIFVARRPAHLNEGKFTNMNIQFMPIFGLNIGAESFIAIRVRSSSSSDPWERSTFSSLDHGSVSRLLDADVISKRMTAFVRDRQSLPATNLAFIARFAADKSRDGPGRPKWFPNLAPFLPEYLLQDWSRSTPKQRSPSVERA